MARPKSTPSHPEQSSTTGAGGERHQQPTCGALLTTNQGAVIADSLIR